MGKAARPRSGAGQTKRVEPTDRPTHETGSAARTRTWDNPINSRTLYQLSYRGTISLLKNCLSNEAQPIIR